MWRNTRTRYGLVARALHWAIAALFIVQIPLGYLTQAMGERPALQFELYQWHKSIGFLTLALAVLRLVWFLSGRKPAPLAGTTRLEAMAAHGVHRALLAFTVLVPLAGWAIASSSPLAIPSYVFNLFVMPNLPLGVSDGNEAFWSWVHAILAYAAGATVLGHAGAALYHHFAKHDATLTRMLHPGRQGRLFIDDDGR